MRRALITLFIVSAVTVLALVTWQRPWSPSGPPRTIVITVDDVPYAPQADDLPAMQRATTRFLAVLKQHEVPAIGFVNEDKVVRIGETDSRTALLEQWLAAGMELGNHNYSHLGLTGTALAHVEDAVIRGDVVTRQLLERRRSKPRYYRHPFSQAGETAEIKVTFESFLRERGYEVAPLTIENHDWIFNVPYTAAKRSGDLKEQARAREEYLRLTMARVAFAEELARSTFGRDIPQVLLLHINDLNVDALDELLDGLEERNYRFIPMEEALRDPAYRTKDGYLGPQGTSWLHRWRMTLRKPDLRTSEPAIPRWVTDQYDHLTRPR